MATNKNQHYVPRGLLKPFTRDREGRSICLFNLDRRILVPNASVGDQCSADYFYGKDSDLDRSIKREEDKYGRIRDIVLGARGAIIANEDRSCLKFFWLMQHMRTEAASRRITEIAEEADSTFGGGGGHLRMQVRDAVSMAMTVCFDSRLDVEDLKTCLVRNTSNVPFVTSDDPAVLTRCPRFRHANDLNGGFGIGSAGAVLLLPISPEVLFVAYDGAVYTVPQHHGWVTVDNTDDVDAFNQPQFLGAFANVYLSEAVHGEYVSYAFERIRARRPIARNQIQYLVPVEITNQGVRYRIASKSELGDHEEAMMQWSPVRIEPLAWPKQLSVRWDAHGFGNGSAAGIVRKAQVPAPGRTSRPFKKVKLP